VARIKPVEFDDRMTLVEHLDELRTRIIVSVLVLVLAIAFCFWQRDLLLDIANRPLPADYEPFTFSPTEPFFVTVKLAFYGGLLLALPVILYQAYAFVLPALTQRERRAVMPFLISVPFLFVAGAVFAYFLITPTALQFLLVTFPGDDTFEVAVRAQDYYSFVVLTVMSVGVLFQIPIAVMSVCRLGITTPQQLARNRRYAILIIAIVAMLLPGQDPVTMLIAMTPLYLLFEFSLLLAKAFGRPPDDVAAATPAEAAR
jgi:sec-independent protein translocase protein TatC